MKRLSNQRAVLCALTHHAHTLALHTLIYRNSSKKFPREICQGLRGPSWKRICSEPVARGCARCRNCAKALVCWERSTSPLPSDGCSAMPWTWFMERAWTFLHRRTGRVKKLRSSVRDLRSFLAPANLQNADTV